MSTLLITLLLAGFTILLYLYLNVGKMMAKGGQALKLDPFPCEIDIEDPLFFCSNSEEHIREVRGKLLLLVERGFVRTSIDGFGTESHRDLLRVIQLWGMTDRQFRKHLDWMDHTVGNSKW